MDGTKLEKDQQIHIFQTFRTLQQFGFTNMGLCKSFFDGNQIAVDK